MRVFTIPPDAGFLPALVKAILAGGFPAPGTAPPGPADLPLWTILVPTRRAARSLEQAFLDRGEARLLPRIRPIGDVDEDLIETGEGGFLEDADLPPAISAIGRELLLVNLIETWADGNPQERLAQEIRRSPVRALGLARGLAELVDSFETEEASLDALAQLFEDELALHRLAILDFLAIIRKRLPAEFRRLGRMGPMERRSQLIRLEAERLRRETLKGPIIAAGSTGSIPATAELLKVIAEHEQGAVVLPGLDCEMDEASWGAVSPQHPQHGLKKLLASWHLKRSDVELLRGVARRPDGEARAWLASEIMRPSETAAGWRSAIAAHRDRIAKGIANMRLVEARHRREEALAISLILRESLEEPGKTAALVTPDRELGRRVKAELKRWNIAIEDSAGEPLVRFAQGSLLSLLIAVLQSDYGAENLAALVHHPLLRMGMTHTEARRAVCLFDLAVLRYGQRSSAPGEFHRVVEEVNEKALADRHLPDAVSRFTPADWSLVADFARRLDDALNTLSAVAGADPVRPLADHLQVLLDCAETFCAAPDSDDRFWNGDAGEVLAALAEALIESSADIAETSFSRAAAFILDYLNLTPVPIRAPDQGRIAILGLLEARLVRPDIVIMAGLNEGKWPAQPESGPWLSRPMRENLGLSMPERHIGLTAHDFAQGFGAETLYLTWSKRVGDAPAAPSRWILRLQMLLNAAGVAAGSSPALAWARGFDRAREFRPLEMPRPKPPVQSRPKSLSFTEIEKLIRDPYAIYARKVLKLEPLRLIAEPADAALRGQLIHETLNRFARAYPDRLPENAADELIRIGNEVFAPRLSEPDVAGFWWPRFKRIAPWLIGEDRVLREGIVRTVGEVPASYEFLVGGEPFRLTGRADRIDLFTDGSARIVDFKTGDPPSANQVESGLSPQLTLEAAVLELGGFFRLAPHAVSDLLYIKLSGGEPPGAVQPIGGFDIMATARRHLANLQNLLSAYASDEASYIPRYIPERENDVSPYDHLSRWGEWGLREASE
jgi:ATP-dependent helicase/nuclease subunit B